MVFWGIWLEGPPDDDPFPNIDALRRHEADAKRGWKMLMWGIFFEIVVAVGFAANDGWKSWQTANEIEKNSPLNQPVPEIKASLILMFHSGKIRTDVGNPGGGDVKAMILIGATSNTNLLSISTQDFKGVITPLFSSEFRTNDFPFILTADFSSEFMGAPSATEGMTVKTTADWNSAMIMTIIDGECDGGVLFVIINHKVLRMTVLPQKAEWGRPLIASSKYPPPKK